VAQFVSWYNHEHRHSAIRHVTPPERHSGVDKAILQRPLDTYIAARKRHPSAGAGRPETRHPYRPSTSTLANSQIRTDGCLKHTHCNYEATGALTLSVDGLIRPADG